MRKSSKVHLVGMLGTGVRGLVPILRANNVQVSGSDSSGVSLPEEFDIPGVNFYPVHDEASAAAAGVPNIAAHAVSHSSAGQAKAGEGAAWVKTAAAVAGVTLIAAGIFFLGGSGSETTTPLGQAGTNAVEQAKPLPKPVTLDTNRVVVLPFKTIGTSGETTDLGYGLVSTLTSKLQPLQSLVVIAKESARKFKDSEQSPREIGQALGAGTIVTGEIQTSGDKIQVNIQLIDANTEALGWGSTFTKTKDKFLDLQNEIATQLASELKGGLDAAEARQLAQKATENAKAQAEYQAGRCEWNKRSKEGFDNAIKHFEKAIELDLNYADPYAGLGDTYGLLPIYNFAKPKDAMPKAKAYAEKAIEKNPNLASAYSSIAWVQHVFDYDWEGAEASYKKAIQLNPNYATGHHWYGELLYQTGKVELAFDHLSKGVKLNPASKVIKHNLSMCCLMLGRPDLAEKYVSEALAIDPNFLFPLETKFLRLKLTKPENAIDRMLSAHQVYPNQPNFLRVLFELYWDSNEREKALNCLVELLDEHHDTFQKTGIAAIYFKMEHSEDAYRWLEQAIKHRESSVPHFSVNPSLKKYQSEPLFKELFKSINHPLYVD